MRQGRSTSLILWIAALDIYCAIVGAVALKKWGAYSTGTQIYYGFSLVAGAVAGCLAVWLLVRGRARPALWMGTAAVLALMTVNQTIGLVWNTILCYSPG